MNRVELRHAIISIVLLAVLCEAVWLYEIVVNIGWSGLNWLKKDLFSPYVICFLTATAYLLPFWLKYKVIDVKVILTLLTLFSINAAAYLCTDSILKIMSLPVSVSMTEGEMTKIRLVRMLVFLIFSFGHYFVTDKLVTEVDKRLTALFMLNSVLMFVLGIITAFFIRGFGNGYSLADAVKMGYPQFWICILMGLSGVFAVVRFSDENKPQNIENKDFTLENKY